MFPAGIPNVKRIEPTVLRGVRNRLWIVELKGESGSVLPSLFATITFTVSFEFFLLIFDRLALLYQDSFFEPALFNFRTDDMVLD